MGYADNTGDDEFRDELGISRRRLLGHGDENN